MGKARLLIRHWWLAVGVAVVVSMVPSTALAAGDANEAGCDAKSEASPGYRLYLPDCRAYELVTPPYKEGAAVLDELGAVSTDGLRVIAGAGGAFAGAGNFWFAPTRNPDTTAYEFVRGDGGWESTALTPPASEYSHSALMAASAENFETTLWSAQQSGLPYHENIYLRTGPNKTEFNLIGPGTPCNEKGEEILRENELHPNEVLHLVGASGDLTRSLFAITATNPGGHSDVWVGDTTEEPRESLYEYAYTGAGDSEPALVGVKNDEVLHGDHYVDENAKLVSSCGTELGSGGSGVPESGSKRGSAYNAVSSSGEVIFFTALECAGSPAVNELYARIGGASTVKLSEPSKEDCEACNTTTGLDGATFQGASQNGERAFFLTEQGLLPGQAGVNLYEYDLDGPVASAEHPNGKISLVSGGSAEPEVQGVVRVSENGERVYFVAMSALTGADRVAGREPEEAAPVPGADNLYVYEPEPGHPGAYRTVFVATLLRPAEEAILAGEEAVEEQGIRTQANKTYAYEFERAETSLLQKLVKGEIGSERYSELLGEAEQAATEKKRAFIHSTVGTLGPSGTTFEDHSVWQSEDTRPAQATPDGEVLVFPSSARLTPGDTSSVPQLFAYDAGDASLTRISIGRAGPVSGNVDTFHDAPQIPSQPFSEVDLPTAADTGLVLADGGSRIFFTSAAELAPGAEGGAVNVYEHTDGGVYLISGGDDASLNSGAPTVSLVGADPTGQDVFFLSAAELVPQYGDTQASLYDARENGGFPAPVLEPGCLGELCRGASGTAPVGSLPGSADQAGGGNVSALPPGPEAAGPQVTRARLLAKALRLCRAKRARKRRAACEARARGRYGKSSASRAHKSTRATGAKREAGR